MRNQWDGLLSMLFMRDQKGFTLLEVMVTISVLVFGVLAVVRVMSTAISADTSIDSKMVALKLAQEEMEIIKNTPYADIAEPSPARATLSSPFGAYDRQVKVDVLDAELTKVTVNVYWTHNAKEEKLVLTTLLADAT